jgi:uridine kinase
MPNILEKYIELNGQIIIFIFGMPCSNKSLVAKQLNEDLHLHLINMNDFLQQDPIEKKVGDNTFKIYEHEGNYDWKKFNNTVDKHKDKGVIIYGNFIYPDKMDFTIDFTFFVGMNTTLCKQEMLEHKMLPEDEKIDDYLKLYLFPHYEEMKKVVKINKFFNVKADTGYETIYDGLFWSLMNLIKQSLGMIEEKP